MSQGSEIFSTYLSEYTSLSASLSKKLLDLSSAAADQRPYLLSQVEREVEECDEIVHSLEMEIMSLPSTHRSQLQPKVKECKIETDGFKRELVCTCPWLIFEENSEFGASRRIRTDSGFFIKHWLWTVCVFGIGRLTIIVCVITTC